MAHQLRKAVASLRVVLLDDFTTSMCKTHQWMIFWPQLIETKLVPVDNTRIGDINRFARFAH
jgi:hypothetical protein